MRISLWMICVIDLGIGRRTSLIATSRSVAFSRQSHVSPSPPGGWGGGALLVSSAFQQQQLLRDA